VKAKKCRNPQCLKNFQPERPMQVTCGYECAVAYVRFQDLKKHKAETRAMRKRHNDNDRRYWIKKARVACHAYIRERDKHRPCISCGRHHSGQYHAGHYRSAGNNSAIMFDERNIHRQCAPCNSHLSGNLVEYRVNLIRKIGLEAVEWLEKQTGAKRWTIDELKAVHAEYLGRLKLLKKQAECR
jgi:hypothetical protein